MENPLYEMKKNRLRKLVEWGYFTQAEADIALQEYMALFNRVNKRENDKIIIGG